MAKKSDTRVDGPNDIGDLIISDNRLGVGTSSNLSTLTVRAKNAFALTGTLAKVANWSTVGGTDTLFLSEISTGDRITVPGVNDETATVIEVSSDTALIVDTPFVNTASGQIATALPSAARFDDGNGNTQVIVTDQGTVGIGALIPNGTLEVVGGSVGDVGSCPVAIHAHTPQASDAWSLALTTDANGGGTCGVMFYINDGCGSATMTLSFVEQDQLSVDPVAFSASGIHLQTAGISSMPAFVNANYTVQAGDHYLLVDAGASGVTITLPPCDTNGQLLTIIKSAGAGVVTVSPATNGTINGNAISQTIGNLYDALSLISTGGTWIASDLASGLSVPTRVSADYAIQPTDRYVLADAGTAGITIMLPPSDNNIRALTIVKSGGSGTVTVTPVPSGQINGHALDQVIGNLYDGLTLISAGNTWVASQLPSGLRAPTAVSSDYTVQVADNHVLADAGSAGITITLPQSDDSLRALTITKSGGDGPVTVAPATSDTINGNAASQTIGNLFDGLSLVAVGGTWVASELVSGVRAPTRVTADYTIQAADRQVLADAGTAGITITLPPSDDNLRQLTITKSGGSGTVMVAPAPSGAINGNAASQAIGNLYDGLKLVSAGSTWIASHLTSGLSVSTPVSADYTIQVTDTLLLVDAGTAGITVTLPDSGDNRRELTITKSAGSGTVTVAPAASGQINGAAASKTISNLYDGLKLMSTASTWIATVLTAA